MKIALMLLGILGISQTLTAQDTLGKYLLPVYVEPTNPISGGFGSRWVTHVTATNRGEEPVYLPGILSCSGIPTCALPQLGGGKTVVDPVLEDSGSRPGHFFWMDPADADVIDVVLRAQDVSRQSQTWGTGYPVVPERAFSSEEIGLSDIAVSPEFRATLRVYDLQSTGDRSARIRVYVKSGSGGPDHLIAEYVFPFAYDPSGSVFEPGYIEWSLWNLPELGTYERVRLTVTSATDDDLRFWAFATVTNNETQHVTVVTPMSH